MGGSRTVRWLLGTSGEVERQFREVQRLAHVGNWEWHVQTDELFWSDELYRIYGTSPEDFTPTYESYLQAAHPEDRRMVSTTVQRAITERRSFSLDHRIVRPDGTIRWVHGRGDLDSDDEDEVQRLYGVAIDITERKRTERFLRQFIASAAHELRTPVAAITHAIDLLSDRELDDTDRATVLRILSLQGGRLRGLSENLLDLATVDREPGPILLSSIDLRAAIDEALERRPPPSSSSLDVAVAEGIPVRAQAKQLGRVLEHLLDNAYEHGGSNIEISARDGDFEVVLEVRDDGPGVPTDLVDDLFSPFRRGGREAGGPGLGLAVVRSLMSGFGGGVDYRPAEPNGARFLLRFSRGTGRS